MGGPVTLCGYAKNYYLTYIKISQNDPSFSFLFCRFILNWMTYKKLALVSDTVLFEIV